MADTINFESGDRICFGHYPVMDPDSGHNRKPRPILWRIMDVKSARYGKRHPARKLLLLSEYSIANMRFSDDSGPTSWHKCSLRKWLNADFYNKAFDAGEKKMIVPVTPKIWDRVYDLRNGGASLTENVFIFSFNDFFRYFSLREKPETVYPVYTVSGKKTGNFKMPEDAFHDENRESILYHKNGERDFWWLRNMVYRNEYAAYVNMDGMIVLEGRWACGEPGLCVRPALWLKIPLDETGSAEGSIQGPKTSLPPRKTETAEIL